MTKDMPADDSFAAVLRAISPAEVSRVLAIGPYQYWCYFADEAAKVVGILAANDKSLAFYYLAANNELKLGPLGVMLFPDLRYVADSERLRPVANGETIEAYLLNDLQQITDEGMVPGFDFSVAQRWQGFLAAHGVQTVRLP